jgi:hypothetical protein
MVIRIRYPNLTYDYVSSQMIDKLIAEKQTIMFYRPSERQWIDVERASIRREAARRYNGIERRNSSLAKIYCKTVFLAQTVTSVAGSRVKCDI